MNRMSVVFSKASAVAAAVALIGPGAGEAMGQSVVGWGQSGFRNIDDVSAVQQISANYRHTVALKNDGTVAAWGVNWASNGND